MLSQADRNYSTRSQSSQANCDSGNTAERLICFGLGLRRRHVEICVPLELSEDGGPIQLVRWRTNTARAAWKIAGDTNQWETDTKNEELLALNPTAQDCSSEDQVTLWEYVTGMVKVRT